ncbi:DUF1127 domain-containing protein [Martelella endophytica]|uniref:YjiS-like domain-containing protein n=1 Tax=Martelella endophytica TaxID=1486262 RepID=A0A0D5LPX0_MAREN|nr:DUF1127 domain-containing protein [Martelella endophytica]AJY46181.1 hypothetical protein TM49_11645 [Martelella endophytica]
MDYQAARKVEKIARTEFLNRMEARRDQTATGLALMKLWAHRYIERRRMRRDLPDLTPEMLQDFGLTRTEAEKLARTPFWRPLP